MADIFLVRHGETAWNRELRFQGQIDVPLNDLGLTQAQRLADRHAVARDSRSLGDIHQRHLVRLGHPLPQDEAGRLARQHCAGRQSALIADDGHVVGRVHAHEDGYAG
jgi:hypothetical protein